MEWQSCDPKVTAKCEECGENKKCAFIPDPYLEEVMGEVIEKYLCEDCYKALINET